MSQILPGRWGKHSKQKKENGTISLIITIPSGIYYLHFANLFIEALCPCLSSLFELGLKQHCNAFLVISIIILPLPLFLQLKIPNGQMIIDTKSRICNQYKYIYMEVEWLLIAKSKFKAFLKVKQLQVSEL